MAPYDPSPIVEVAFSYGPFNAAPVWTDISAYVMSAPFSRGRSSEFDYFPSGTLTLTLADDSRRFDPLNTAGPYYGNLKPMVPIRVRALHSAVYYPLFYGFVDGWVQGYTDANTITYVEVQATDGTKVLANTRLPQSVYESVVLADAPRFYWRLDEATGRVAADVSGNKHDGIYSNDNSIERGSSPLLKYTSGSIKTTTAVTANPPVVSDEAAARVTSLPVTIEMWVASDGQLTDDTYYLFWQGDLDDANSRVALRYFRSAGVTTVFATAPAASTDEHGWTVTLDDSRTHHVVAVIESGAKTLYIDGNNMGPAASTGTNAMDATGEHVWVGTPFPAASWKGWVDDVSYYDVALTSAQVQAHYIAAAAPWDGDSIGTRLGRVLDEISWPAALRDLDTGETTLGPADLAGVNGWEYIQLAASSDPGNVFIGRDGSVTFHDALALRANTASSATFSDDGADYQYLAGSLRVKLDDTFIYNEASVQRKYGSPQTASDATSITAYGPRTRSVSGLLMQTDAQARGLAERIVYRYKDPLSRADRWRVQPQGQPAMWPTILARELGDRVTLEVQPTRTGARETFTLIIEAIRHTITTEAWIVEFQGSPVDPHIANYFTWGGDGATQGWGVGRWA